MVAANYYPKAYIMYPASVLVGLSSPLLWTSAYSYITDLASVYAQNTNVKKEVMTSRLMGIFYMFDQSAQIWGNLLSYLILSPEEQYDGNATMYDKCGADFNEKEYNDTSNIHSVERKTIDMLCFIYIGICFCSILLTLIFLDQRHVRSREKFSIMVRKSTKLFLSTIKQIGNVTQVLLIPITILIGLEQAFLSAMFSKAFISCTNNPKYVGLVFIVYGVCNSIGCFTFGQLIKIIGRCPFLICAVLIDCSLVITMLIWKPGDNTLVILCVIIGLWGITDGIWLTQITVLYGILFPEKNEIAFANFCLWESFGYLVFYIIMPFIRIRIALIILLIMLILGITDESLYPLTIPPEQRIKCVIKDYQYFTELDSCIEYIRMASKRDRIFVITLSTQEGQEIAESCNQCSWLKGIYIHQKTSSDSSTSNKRLHYFDDWNILLQELAADIFPWRRQSLAFRFFEQKQRAIRDVTAEAASFMWSLILLDVLKEIPSSKQTLDDMLDMCADYYRDNAAQLKMIEEFRSTYEPYDAIRWYTRDSFLYHRLNAALRTEDIDALLLFRPFIVDLCTQSEEEQRSRPFTS
ncbi:hypothetical protein I4U23_005008 [Adineta vaga]|nr:hypothetical protein I4U23_005008 [Adineta vaga]